jgi:inner membrane protein
MKIEISNTGKWYQSLTIKIGLLVFLGLLFLIPLEMIKSVILERQKNSEKVRTEISDQWAIRQCVTGPVLNIPVKTIPKNKEESSSLLIWHILPEHLKIIGEVSPEIRQRGIYKAVVYDSHLEFSGTFIIPASSEVQEYEINWKDAYYTMGISDNRGIRGDLKIITDSSEFEAVPGVRDIDLFKSGISFIPAISKSEKKHDFKISLDLSGSEGLLFIPVGKTTETIITSAWETPSFTGRFLPAKRTVNHSGFNAEWLVTNLNRNFPQNWVGNEYNISENSFGVDLLLTVDHYQKSFRCSKYGLLFIALTFMVLIFIELTKDAKIHIFNYFLIALSLALFFSLLTALSEHLGFSLAYFISAAATILLLTLFSRSFIPKKNGILIIFGLLVLLYAFIYIILSLNDLAFLAGNIGLFVLLAVVMWVSGKINLFQKEVENNKENVKDSVN